MRKASVEFSIDSVQCGANYFKETPTFGMQNV